jgi:alkaline phosphatase D
MKVSAFDERGADDLWAVGAVNAQSARVWLRASEPGTHVLELWPADRRAAAVSVRFEVSPDPARDGTHSLRYPHDFPDARPLAPATRHELALFRDKGAHPLGQGSFETAPADTQAGPDRFSIAFMSCHQPFGDDGLPHPDAIAMLAQLGPAFRERAVKRVLLLGDQMYADYPPAFSLFDPEWFRKVAPRGRAQLLECTREEVCTLYQERYRVFWSPEGYQSLQRNFPCYAIPDDHELIDNFGSDPEHATERWRAFHEGALDACYDYQISRTLGLPRRPESFHFSFAYGPFAAFVMDLRSQRRADQHRVRIFGQNQLRALGQFLAGNSQRPVVAVALSVPLVHIPNWLADSAVELQGEGSDASDRWEYAKAQQSREQLIDVLVEHRRRHPSQQLVLLGGDIHAGLASSIELDGAAPFVQLVSSAVTNLESGLHREVAKVIARAQDGALIGEGRYACRARLLEGEPGAAENPYGQLNVGILEHRRVGRNEWALRTELITCDASTRAARTVYARNLGISRGP